MGTKVAVGLAVVGVLRPHDVDQLVTIETPTFGEQGEQLAYPRSPDPVVVGDLTPVSEESEVAEQVEAQCVRRAAWSVAEQGGGSRRRR